RREAFLHPPTRRNQVWQMDFFELETAGGGTWRSGDVVDYWAKVVLAGPVTKTQTHRDAIASVLAAIDEAERLLGRPLIEDLTDPDGAVHPIFLVTDNGPCFKADRFAQFIDTRAELTHIRTRKKSPQTNGMIERYHGSIKNECLWRHLPADGLEMTDQVDAFRQLYNEVRPHESLDGQRPIPTYLAAPAARVPRAADDTEPSTTISTPVQTRQVERIP
ncbi:MAG: integrase core domain-containing protein, partial [Solirubrobacteraceae bacterium]|nr:integrase core domain-containing protein [Solirubrobacteraceae bacterium]